MKVDQVNIIKKYLEEHKDKMIEFLSNLVKWESPSTNKNIHTGIQDLLTTKLSSLGMEVTKIAGVDTGGHLYSRFHHRRKREANQLLIGHSDTVWPLNTIKEMELQVLGDKIKGPGVYDMKAGLTQIVFALQCIEALGMRPPMSPIIFINSDEEIGSRESTKYIKWLSRCSERAYVLEPPLGLDGKLKTARKGIGKFTLEIIGKAAHAGLDPGKGASAILELSHQIQKLFALNDLKKGISVNVGLVEGGERANVIAPISRAVIDLRVPTYQAAEEVTAKILALEPANPNVCIVVEGGIGRPPMEFDAKNRKLWKLAQEQGDLLGIDLKNGSAGGGSDGNTTSIYIPTLDGLGTPGDGAHALHEFAFVDKLVERTALLTLLIMAE